MKVLFAGGGTGGHLYPAFAIAERLRRRGDGVLFVGTADRIEARIVPDAGYRLLTVAAHPLRRGFSLDVVRTLVKNVVGFFQSLALLARERPDAIIATGGYACVPVVLAARLRRRLLGDRATLAMLEPNAVAGIASRVLAPRVDEVWDARSTGIPVRSSLLRLPTREDAAERLALDPAKRTVVAMGGSQGARSINDAVLALVDARAAPPNWQILLVSGERDYERVHAAMNERARVRAYLDDPADAFAVADVLLVRAGASTLAEVSAARVPAILVPYPHSTESHQRANADAAASRGAAVVVEDERLSATLPALLENICRPDRLEAMRERARMAPDGDAAGAIVARIDAMVGRRAPR